MNISYKPDLLCKFFAFTHQKNHSKFTYVPWCNFPNIVFATFFCKQTPILYKNNWQKICFHWCLFTVNIAKKYGLKTRTPGQVWICGNGYYERWYSKLLKDVTTMDCYREEQLTHWIELCVVGHCNFLMKQVYKDLIVDYGEMMYVNRVFI